MLSRMNIPNFRMPFDGYKVYHKFRGVDFSTDDTQIDDSRSPWAVNLISDVGGYPEKRLGWRSLYRFADNCKINGIWFFNESGKQQLIVHAGSRLVRICKRDSTVFSWLDCDDLYEQELLSGLNDDRSTGFYFNGDLWILTGKEYLHYNGDVVKNVEDEAYVPTTTINILPNGGGSSYESVNLLSKRRKNTFVTDGVTTDFFVDTKSIDRGSELRVWNNGEELTKDSKYDINYNYSSGRVVIQPAPPRPAAAGTATLTIEFQKAVENAENKIKKCKIFTTFGINNSTRVFLAGNPDEPATEWYSGLKDATYFPDNQRIEIGSQDFKIVSYVKYQGELLVLKEDNRQEVTIWNHVAEMSDIGTAIFPVKEGLTGIGAVGCYAVQTLLDDPLFLSPRGIFSPVTSYNYPNFQSSLKCRSERVNSYLTKEKNLEDAVSAVWQGYYILVVNDNAYVADSNQPKSDNGYEWYYWKNIPARCMNTYADILYFGTEDGRICRFNNDMLDHCGVRLMSAYNDDNEPIEWEWHSKLDCFGYPTRYKTLSKRGNGIQLKTFTNSSCEIYLRTERDFGIKVDTPLADTFNFNDIDFNRFSFCCLDIQEFIFKKKIKKFLFIQLQLKGKDLNEGFGIYSAALHYNIGGYAKRKGQRQIFDV